MFSDRVASMFSVIELFFGIGEDNFGRGKNGGLSIYNYRSDYWPRARGTFVPNWRVYASICGLSLPPNQLMEFKSVGVSKHLLGDGKPVGVFRYRHPLHHARGVSATLRRGQAGHECCAQETRHSGRPLQGSKYSTDMILNIILNPSGEHCRVQCRFHPDHLRTTPHNTEPTPHLSTGAKSLITPQLIFYLFRLEPFSWSWVGPMA